VFVWLKENKPWKWITFKTN